MYLCTNYYSNTVFPFHHLISLLYIELYIYIFFKKNNYYFLFLEWQLLLSRYAYEWFERFGSNKEEEKKLNYI